MADENEIIAKFVADIEQYKAQIAEMNTANKQAAASTESVSTATDRLSSKSKTASGSINVMSRGLQGIAGLLGVTGRLFGVNTDKLEGFLFASQQLVRTGQDVARTVRLTENATKANTVATVAQTTAERVLNAVRSASLGVISLVVTGVIALGSAIFAYVQNLNEEERALKRKQAIDKEQIKVNNQLIESISKRNEQEAETILNAAVRKGQVTEQQAEEIALQDKFFKERIRIDKVIEKQRAEASKANRDAFGRLSIADQARINDNRKKLEDEAERTLQTGLSEVREGFAKKNAEDRKKDAEKLQSERDASLQREFKAFTDYWDKVDKQDRERADKLLMQQLDEMQKAGQEKKKKAEELAKESEDLDTASINSFFDAADRENKKNRDKAEKDAEEARLNRIEKEKQMLDTIFQAYQAAFDKRQALLDEERGDQEKAIDTQRRLAEQGLANTLVFEEKRAAELKRRQQIEKENAKKVKLLETFLNSLAEFSKTDPKTAINKALLQVALATAASAVFAEKGGIIGEIGARSNLRRKHKGGGDVLLHAQTGEGILSRREMDNLGQRNFHLLKDAARFPIRDNVFALPQIAAVATPGISNTAVVRELRELNNRMKNMKQQTIEVDSVGNLIVTSIEKGVKTITEKHLRRPRF